MKKTINLLSVLVMIIINIVTPFGYAEMEEIKQSVVEE
jgi:hypothetical protein